MLTLANAELIKKGKMSTQWVQRSFGFGRRRMGKKGKQGERKAGEERYC